MPRKKKAKRTKLAYGKPWKTWDVPKLGRCCVPGCPNVKSGGTDRVGSYASSNCQAHESGNDWKLPGAK